MASESKRNKPSVKEEKEECEMVISVERMRFIA
jgi:hypothetical protein